LQTNKNSTRITSDYEKKLLKQQEKAQQRVIAKQQGNK
jgi:hypothetical protein